MATATYKCYSFVHKLSAYHGDWAFLVAKTVKNPPAMHET